MTPERIKELRVRRAIDSFAREVRREALEEAARVCAHNAELYPVPGTGWESSMECAAAIRALADAPDAGTGG